MVTYNYTVTPVGSTSLRDVMLNIATELAQNPVIERDIEVTLDRGTYSGFAIPDSALFPLLSSGYRLIIKSGGDYFPIIDFNVSPEEQVVGIDVGSGNPNVTIKGLRVQYFSVGIRAGLNSHFPIVEKCIINNNRNVGIFFEQTDEAQALQNVVINGDFGIVARLTKSAALIHNTIFQNGAISSESNKSISCIWAELANDYGNGLADTGVLHLLGNIGWNMTGRCLTLFGNNVELSGAVISNFNDWLIGDPDEFIVIEDNAFLQGSNAQPREVINSLLQWKTLGFDNDSISQDPKFIAPIRIRSERNGFAIDLNILPVSPVLGLVPSFAFNSAAASQWLPSYVDSQAFATDILRSPRQQSGTAIGSNDSVSTAGFFGQDVFSNPLDLGLTKECGVDPFANVLYKSLELWFPKIKKGYFYSNEREYYLYAKKEAATLGELAMTEMYLPGILAIDQGITVKVGGIEVSTAYFDIRRDKFILYHRDLPVQFKDTEVEIEGKISTWRNFEFFYQDVLYRFKISEGVTRFFLPTYYVNTGPVVITDDYAYYTDSDYLANREFCLDIDLQQELSEIKFANDTNLLPNSQFQYGDYDWDISNGSVVRSSAPAFSVAGENVASIADKGYIRNRLPISSDYNYSLSFHTRSAGSGDFSWTAELLNASYQPLGLVFSGSKSLSSSWERQAILFNGSGENFSIDVPNKPIPCNLLANYNLPASAAYVDFKVAHTYSPAYPGNFEVDALQYEQTDNPTLYHKQLNLRDFTVEYETSSEEYFIDSNLAMSPISNLLSDGFLFIPEIPAAMYSGPNDPTVTTLHEWRWPEGRRGVMPWARTKGKDKLRKRPLNRFNKLPDPKPEIVYPVYAYAGVKDVKIQPSVPRTIVGTRIGEGIAIQVTDTDDNPMSLASVRASVVDYNARYPGILAKSKYGLKEQLGVIVFGQTDNAGSMAIKWIPPEEPAGLYRGEIPAARLQSALGEEISVIDTEYVVSADNFGNIIIFNNRREELPTVASEPRIEVHEPALTKSDSNISLAYPADPGSVVIIVNGVRYKEAKINVLNSNEFYVDYDRSVVTVKGRANEVHVEYIPRYVFINPEDPYKIMIYKDKVFGNYTGDITVGYDLAIILRVEIDNPGVGDVLTREFDIVAQNPLLKEITTINKIALEF